MGTIVKTIGPNANVRASEGAGTTVLTAADVPIQIFNLSTARQVNLPSTGVKAGDVWRIENQGAADLTVASSSGTALTIANSANIDATIQKGYVLLMALVDAPTGPSQWRVADLWEEQSLTNASSGNFTTLGFKLTRRLRTVTLSANVDPWFVSNNTISQSSGAVVPLRFRPAVATRTRQSTSSGIVIYFNTDGTIQTTGGGGGTSVDQASMTWSN